MVTLFVKGKPAMGSCRDRVARAGHARAANVSGIIFSRRTYIARTLCVRACVLAACGVANTRACVFRCQLPLTIETTRRFAKNPEAHCWPLIGVRNPRQYLAFSSPPPYLPPQLVLALPRSIPGSISTLSFRVHHAYLYIVTY